jgi:hypothetical protein
MFKFYFGKLLNLAGWPGIVRECDYRWADQGIKVAVRKTELHTIVTVNDVDVYFTRLTGKIDGTGRILNCDNKEAQTLAATPPPSTSETP